MQFSIWEYLRARARDSVLAGIDDALNIVEQGDTNGGQSVAANALVARLAGAKARELPEPSQNGNGKHHEAESRNGLLDTPRRPTEPATFDDELERRIDEAASQRAEEKPSTTVSSEQVTNRKRGRPPKKQEKDE